MPNKAFTQMTDTEFKQVLDGIRDTAGQMKLTQPVFEILCLRNEAINLSRLKTLLDALNDNNNIHSLHFRIDDLHKDRNAQARGINVEGTKIIAEFLKTNTTIHSLDLSHHTIGTEGANLISEALLVNNTLQDLYLAHCSIGDINQVSTALGLNKAIKKIDLHDNALGDEGAKKMGDVLKLNQTLTDLNFDLNNISDKGAYSFAEGLILNNTLKSLSIIHSYDRIPPSNPLSMLGINEFNKMFQYNLSLCGLVHRPQSPNHWIAKEFDALIERNQLFSRLDYSISDFRKKLNAYSTPFKTTNISRRDLGDYLSLAHYHSSSEEYFRIRANYSYPLVFSQLSENDKKTLQDAKAMWRETKVNENNKGKTALELYQANMEKIKELKDQQFEVFVETPELKEKIIKKLRDAPEALDLAYYGRDAECLELDPLLRVAKLETILKTTQNKAHQEDAKESLLPLYYSLMGRTKDGDEEKTYALSILACGGEDEGIFSQANIAAQYKIENIEAELEKRKAELKLNKAIEEENQPQKTNEQKIYSDAGKSSFTKFPSQSEGATTNATPGASTSPSSTQIEPPPNADDEKPNQM